MTKSKRNNLVTNTILFIIILGITGKLLIALLIIIISLHITGFLISKILK